MIIKFIELTNIRTYEKQKIFFDKGINFLLGDIGSGKSTILLAIEFCLFGFLKGEVESFHLLRKGEKKGQIKINFLDEKNNTEIQITRNIEKSKSGISQKNGFVKIENNIEEFAPTDLNNLVFEIFNFPKEFLKKNRNLIYRNLVYTAQEDLKKILFLNTETKLDIIRKIFNVDKYKKLKEGFSIYLKKLKSDILVLNTKILDEKSFLDEDIQLKNTIKELESKLKISKQNENKLKIFENKLRQNIRKNEDDKKILVEKKIQINEVKNKNLSSKKNISNLKEEILNYEKIIQNFDLEKHETQKKQFQIDIKNTLKDIEEESLNKEKLFLGKENISEKNIFKFDDLILDINKKIQNKNLEIKNLENLILDEKNKFDKINKIEICPTCNSKIDEKHKNQIFKSYENKKNESENKIKKISLEILNYEKELEKINLQKKEKDEIEKKVDKVQKNLDVLNKKIESLENEIKSIEFKIEKKDFYIKKIKESNQKIKEINLDILNGNEIKSNEENLEKEVLENEKNKNILDEKNKFFLEKFNLVSKNINTILTKIDFYNKTILKNESKITEFNKIKNEIKLKNKIKSLIQDKLIYLCEDIERNLFTNLYSNFLEEFENIFKEMIEEEIDIRLDFDFSILIEQNGFDIDISNLSGGEKSALALSYKLALKKLVEDNFNKLNLDFLILDEPTDGFSKYQIDKLSNVLKNLKTSQIIIVSHDENITKICDNKIKLEKINHKTLIS